MSTMKAVRIHEFGGPDALKYEEAPRPEAREGEVLIRVIAAGVNPFDWKVREGYLNGWIQHTFPLTLGWDLSGVIEAVGPGVTGLKSGDEVFGRADTSRNGAYAEYIAVKASEITPKPATIDYIHAAAIPHAGLAAWNSLFTTAGLAAGQTVLIQGAAGGVGHLAVQFAKQAGARVIGTSSGNNLDFQRELGVDEAIDYTTTPFEEVVRDADVVLDTVGGEVLQRSWAVLKPGGMLVSIVEAPSEETAAARGVRQAFASAVADPEILSQIAGLVDAGKVKPHVSTVLPLSEIRQAHLASQSMHTRGKIVLRVAD